MRASRRIAFDRPLVGEVDPEERFALFPPDFTMKGMFFSRMLELAPPGALDRTLPQLHARPTLGRYLPFADYPQVDFSRLAHHVATLREPGVDTVEAMRRLARLDVGTFAASRLGSVVFALLGGTVTEALQKLPEMYRISLRGGEVRARALGPREVELAYTDFYGWLDCYAVGHVEALVAHFGARCELEYDLDGLSAGRFHVHLLD